MQPGRRQPLATQSALVHQRAGQEWLTSPLLLRPPHRLQGAVAAAVQVQALQLKLVALALATELQLGAQLRGRAALPMQWQLLATAHHPAQARLLAHAVPATLQHPGMHWRSAQYWVP